MFRFIQLSGVRWGATPRLMSPDVLPEGLTAELRGDASRAFARACALALEHHVDAVVVVGLVSQPDCTADDLRDLFAHIAALAPVPVVVLASAPERAPGGALHPRTALALGLGPPPPNLVVIDRPRVVCDHALVTGAPLAEVPSILLTQGQSREGGWAWVAAGGALEPAVLFGDDGRPLGGDPGAPSAHELPGPVGGAWLVELEGANAGFTALATAPRRGWLVDLDVSAVTRGPELAERAGHALDRVGARPADLVWFRLTGAWRVPALPALAPGVFAGRVAHAALAPGSLTLSPPTGPSTADLHLRALMARSEDGLESIRLALSAWQGAS